MTNHNNPHADTNKVIADIAELHRLEHSHTVILIDNAGWLCEVCDEDHEDVLAEYYAEGVTIDFRKA